MEHNFIKVIKGEYFRFVFALSPDQCDEFKSKHWMSWIPPRCGVRFNHIFIHFYGINIEMKKMFYAHPELIECGGLFGP